MNHFGFTIPLLREGANIVSHGKDTIHFKMERIHYVIRFEEHCYFVAQCNYVHNRGRMHPNLFLGMECVRMRVIHKNDDIQPLIDFIHGNVSS